MADPEPEHSEQAFEAFRQLNLKWNLKMLDLSKRHSNRVIELLEANNRYQDEARTARAELAQVKAELKTRNSEYSE